jgi:hypothetical protein
MERRREVIALFIACLFALRGFGGVLSAWVEANLLGLAWSLLLVGIGVIGAVAWRFRHRGTQAITLAANAYFAGGLAAGSLRVGQTPWLWILVALVALMLLWQLRR